MKKRGKKGISNIEMSIAIILFVTAVFSIILIFNVYYKNDKIDASFLEDFEKTFLENSENYTKIGIKVNGPGCINIPLNKNLNSGNLGVFLNNSQISSKVEGDRLYFESFSDKYYEIYSFPLTNLIYTRSCADSSYTYTVQGQGQIFIKNRFSQIASTFSNANFVVKDDSGIELYDSGKIPPKGAEVLSKTFFILVYDNDDKKIKNCQVNIQVWK
jgi:hypothetical protein